MGFFDLTNMNMCDPSSSLYQINSIKDNFMNAMEDGSSNCSNHGSQSSGRSNSSQGARKMPPKKYFNPRGFKGDENWYC